MAIETVLLAIGENDDPIVDQLTEATAALADHGARVVVLHIFGEAEYEGLMDNLDYDVSGPEVTAEVAQRHETCEAICAGLREAGIDPEVRGDVDDDRPRAVLAGARDVDADHLVIGGRSRSPTGKAIFGDHAQQILLDAPCPVTFVRRNSD